MAPEKNYRKRMFAKSLTRELETLGKEYQRIMGAPFDGKAVAELMGWDIPKAPKTAKAEKI